jgi:hypothetical protein
MRSPAKVKNSVNIYFGATYKDGAFVKQQWRSSTSAFSDHL